MSNWQKKKVFTKIEHRLYSHPLPCDPDNKENYCIITFSEGGTASVIAITDDEKILFLEQYRPAVDRCIINLPGGRVDNKNISAEEQIKKELLEETGCSFESVNRFYEPGLYQNPTRITDITTIFIAREVREAGKPTSKETTEKDSKVLTIHLNDIKEMFLCNKKTVKGEYLWPENIKGNFRNIESHEICDLTTVAALTLLCLKKQK